jgi:hypothetical protein
METSAGKKVAEQDQNNHLWSLFVPEAARVQTEYPWP